MEKFETAATPASAMAVCDGVAGGENKDLIMGEGLFWGKLWPLSSCPPVGFVLVIASVMALLKPKKKHFNVLLPTVKKMQTLFIFKNVK